MGVAISSLQSRSTARKNLYDRFRPRLLINPDLDRAAVSFQANRNLSLYRWFRYKEAFSAEFVRYAIEKSTRTPGVLLDPFAGTGSTLFAARELGWDTLGIELLPVGFFVIEARLAAESVAPETFEKELKKIESVEWETHSDPGFALRHIPITEGAFSRETERCIAGFRAYCEQIKDGNLRTLFHLAALAVLESVSYTRKDGQYLRWDRRARKKRVKSNFDKGAIRSFDSAIKEKLLQIHGDLCDKTKTQLRLFDTELQHKKIESLDLQRGSCLEMLPEIEDESIDLVITSPPYCNRYDYTRTYALELIYLGMDAEQIKKLRQDMLSCTVENKSKMTQLNRAYKSAGRESVFDSVVRVYDAEPALQEVLEILAGLRSAGRLNNSNIPNMVKNYFLEMAFAVYELGRLLRPGGRIVMVNDNVRYAGEEIPVDLILSDFAESFGMSTECIWTLGRGKGNSSQQMGAHGRTELRKCVYIWRKT